MTNQRLAEAFMGTRLEQIMEQVKNFPQEPGCYLMKDAHGKIFYIGKAVNLRNRVQNYFSGSDTRAFVSFLAEILYSIETIVVRNQTESLLLERTLIKKHQPEYNILLKDDKNYIVLRLDTKKHQDRDPLHLRYPRLEIVRKVKNDQARYFGPYPSAQKLRTTLRLINRFFKLRTCADKVIDNRSRPCIQYQIGRCPAPCVKDVPNYFDEIANVALFLQGKSEEIVKRLKQQMFKAAEEEDFENAAQFRDQIHAVETSVASQAVASGSSSQMDVFGSLLRNGLLAITRLTIRDGAVTGHQNEIFSTHHFPVEELLSSYLSQLYVAMDAGTLPHELVLDIPLEEDAEVLALAIGEKSGRAVRITVPQRGRKCALLKIAKRNAELALAEHLRVLLSQNSSLVSLKKFLDLPVLPKVIECFDISLFQGSDAVASKVCFVDGKADKTKYRQFNIQTVDGMDDFAMLYEAISRRLKRGIEDKDLPDLLLVDGGKGQLSSALKACEDCGIDLSKSRMTVAGIAKARLLKASKDDMVRSAERIFLPGEALPRELPLHSPERHLVERIRDEAHRFAIERHRKKRAQRSISSVLDSIPGIGDERRKLLLRKFGSVAHIAGASVDEIAALKGISKALALLIHDRLKG